MKVVVDTMIWLSYCTKKDSYRRRLIERAVNQRVRLYVSQWILDELQKVLTVDLGKSKRFAALGQAAILRKAKLVRLPTPALVYVPGDSEDNPVVQTAVLCKADYLVTADDEILKVRNVQDVRIVTAVEWDQLLAAEPA